MCETNGLVFETIRYPSFAVQIGNDLQKVTNEEQSRGLFTANDRLLHSELTNTSL